MNTVSDILWDSAVRVHESIILLPSLMWKSTAVPFMWRKRLRGFSWSPSTVCAFVFALFAGVCLSGWMAKLHFHRTHAHTHARIHARTLSRRSSWGDKAVSRFLPSSHLSIPTSGPSISLSLRWCWQRLCGSPCSPSGCNSPFFGGEQSRPAATLMHVNSPKPKKAELHLWRRLVRK